MPAALKTVPDPKTSKNREHEPDGQAPDEGSLSLGNQLIPPLSAFVLGYLVGRHS